MRAVILSSIALLISGQAFAVPVPWRNCGAPGDVVSVEALLANAWPPGNKGPTGPVFASAQVDPDSARVERLRVGLYPLNWVFDLDRGIHTRVDDGFVFLPDSWVGVGSPPMRLQLHDFRGLPEAGPPNDTHGYLEQLPVPAGPVNSVDTFPLSGDPADMPFILVLRGAIGSAIPTMEASFWMTYNGISGFPVHPEAGGVYSYHIDIREPSQQVLCMDVSVPIKFDHTLGASVEHVPFGKVDFAQAAKDTRIMTWTYGDEEEVIPSAAMEPEVEFRSCFATGAALAAEEHHRAVYDPQSGVWSVVIPDQDRDSDCVEARIHSRLTGQVNGPFRISGRRI